MLNTLKYACLLVCCVLLPYVGKAQPRKGPNRERVESARIGLITSRLDLTPEQSTKFWPLYNEFNDKRVEIRQSLRRLRTEDTAASASDEQIRNDLKTRLDLRQREVDLEKEYTNKFMKVITPRQVAELYRTEQEFTRMMLERLEHRQGQRRQPGRP